VKSVNLFQEGKVACSKFWDAYEIRQGSSGNIILDVQIVKEIWMRHPDVTMLLDIVNAG